jgi:hypothetical protein
MSRSFKKTPRAGDTKSKFHKRYANKLVRRDKLNEGFNRGLYKKNYQSWNICDFEDVDLSFVRFLDFQFPQRQPTEEEIAEFQERYKKYFIRK